MQELHSLSTCHSSWGIAAYWIDQKVFLLRKIVLIYILVKHGVYGLLNKKACVSPMLVGLRMILPTCQLVLGIIINAVTHHRPKGGWILCMCPHHDLMF